MDKVDRLKNDFNGLCEFYRRRDVKIFSEMDKLKADIQRLIKCLPLTKTEGGNEEVLGMFNSKVEVNRPKQEEKKSFKRWRAEKCEEYWFAVAKSVIYPCGIGKSVGAGTGGEAGSGEFESLFEEDLWNIGNYFKTKKEAEDYKDYAFQKRKYADIVLEMNAGKSVSDILNKCELRRINKKFSALCRGCKGTNVSYLHYDFEWSEFSYHKHFVCMQSIDIDFLFVNKVTKDDINNIITKMGGKGNLFLAITGKRYLG